MVLMKKSYVLRISTILGWFCFVCLPQLQGCNVVAT